MAKTKYMSLLKEAWLALKYVMDPQVPFSRKIWIVLSMLYLISPVDFMPDSIFGIGFIDDITVILLMLSFMAHRLKNYYKDQNASVRGQRQGDTRDAIDVEYEVIDDGNNDKK